MSREISDANLLNMILSGPGMLYAAKTAERGVFRVSMNHLANLSVKEGRVSYGGSLVFTASEILYITHPVCNRRVRGAVGWDTAKALFRDSLVLATVSQIHTSFCRLQMDSYLSATLYSLPKTNEIRVLMMPFFFGALQASGNALRQKPALLEAFSLDERGLLGLISDAMNSTWGKAYSFPAHLAALSGDDGLENAPFFQEGRRLYSSQTEFVESYVGRYVSASDEEDFRLALFRFSGMRLPDGERTVTLFLIDCLMTRTLIRSVSGLYIERDKMIL